MIRSILIAIALVFTLGGWSSPAPAQWRELVPPLSLASPIPEFSAPDLKGATVALTRLEGKPLLVNLWATWCPPCVHELPLLEALHKKHAADGLQVVGISVDRDLGLVEKMVDKHKLSFRVLHNATGTAARPFRVQQLPATFLYDRKGKLVWSTLDEIKPDDPAFAAALKQALAR